MRMHQFSFSIVLGRPHTTTMSADSIPTKSASSSTTAKSSLVDMSQADYESLLPAVHRKAKETAKLDSTAEDVLLAKLACYAIRELHAEKIVCQYLYSTLPKVMGIMKVVYTDTLPS